MEIAWAEFTPVASFAGGAMIGLAALFLMLLYGRVMGMSGILSGLLVKRPDWAWRLAFVIGVIVGPLLFMGLIGAPVERQAVMSGPLLYVAAFLVGLGTAVGSGCTSGSWYLWFVTVLTALAGGGDDVYSLRCDHR